LDCLATFMMHDSLLNFHSVFFWDTLYMLFYNCSCSYIMWRIFGLPCIHLVEWHKCCTSWHFTSVHNLENICGCSVWVDHQMKQSTNTYNFLLSSPLKLSSHLYNESLSQQRTYRYWWGGGGGGGQSPNLEGKLQLPQKYAEVKFLGR
jgi:hypothetical protein